MLNSTCCRLNNKNLDFLPKLDYNRKSNRSYSLVAKHSNGNAEIQVRFLVGAPL